MPTRKTVYNKLNTNLATLATKGKLEADEDKIEKTKMHDLSYFLGNFFLVIIVFTIYLLINQHLIHYS